MRISDWSSDVCSSDLQRSQALGPEEDSRFWTKPHDSHDPTRAPADTCSDTLATRPASSACRHSRWAVSLLSAVSKKVRMAKAQMPGPGSMVANPENFTMATNLPSISTGTMLHG